MSRRSLVLDFSDPCGPVTAFDDAKDCDACHTANVGIRAPDSTPFCQACFGEHHPALAREVPQ